MMAILDPVQPPFHIGILLIDGFGLISYAATADPFHAANQMSGAARFRITNLSVDGIAARSQSGARIAADQSFDRFDPFDLLLVIAGGNPWNFDNRRTFRFLQMQAARGVRLGGVSAGPIILARAGLMADRRLTVHWEHAPALSEQIGDVRLEHAIFVMEGDRITAAGGTAPLDMSLAIIAEQQGAEFARAVSDSFLHAEMRGPGTPQRSGPAERHGITHPRLAAAVDAMDHHLADPLDLRQLARISGVSPRQLNRLFAEQLGQSTMGFYRALRLDAARRLLSLSTLPITDVALATGFAGSAHFSRVYLARFGAPPSALRRNRPA